MMLAELQRALVGLIRATYQPAEDDAAYLKAVARSQHLQMVREVVRWWRAFGVSRYCVLTSTLLKQQGLFDQAITSFIRSRAVSPFVEELGGSFLEEMSLHTDTLVRSLAQFELALLRVKNGDAGEYTVEWDYDPHAVLGAVLHGRGLDRDVANGAYRTIISRRLPEMFCVVSSTAAAGQQ